MNVASVPAAGAPLHDLFVRIAASTPLTTGAVNSSPRSLLAALIIVANIPAHHTEHDLEVLSDWEQRYEKPVREAVAKLSQRAFINKAEVTHYARLIMGYRGTAARRWGNIMMDWICAQDPKVDPADFQYISTIYDCLNGPAMVAGANSFGLGPTYKEAIQRAVEKMDIPATMPKAEWNELVGRVRRYHMGIGEMFGWVDMPLTLSYVRFDDIEFHLGRILPDLKGLAALVRTTLAGQLGNKTAGMAVEDADESTLELCLRYC